MSGSWEDNNLIIYHAFTTSSMHLPKLKKEIVEIHKYMKKIHSTFSLFLRVLEKKHLAKNTLHKKKEI